MLLENMHVKLEPSEDKSGIVPIDADAADADAERRSESTEELSEKSSCETPFVLSEYVYMDQFLKPMSSGHNMMKAIKRELPVSETIEFPSPKRPKNESSVQQLSDSIIRNEGASILKSPMKEAKYHLIELVKEEFANWNLTKMNIDEKFKPQKWNHIRESMEDKFEVEFTVPQCMDIWRILFISLRQYRSRRQYPFEQEPGWIFWKPLEFLRRQLDEVEGVVCPQMRVRLDSQASTSTPSSSSQPKPLSLEKIKMEIEETGDPDEVKDIDMFDASSLLPSMCHVPVNDDITLDQDLQFTKNCHRSTRKFKSTAPRHYLIGLMRESPIIWNGNILDAAAVELKYAPAAWESISGKMSTFFQCSITVDDCKQMWGALVRKFNRYRKELKSPDSQGDKLDSPRNWPFWIPMKFLKDYYENMEKQAESQMLMVREQARFCSICPQKLPEKEMQSMRDMGHAIQVEQTLRCAPRLSEKFKVYDTIWVCRKHMRDYYNIIRMQKLMNEKKDVHKKVDDRCIKSVVNALTIVHNSMRESDGVVEYETSESNSSNIWYGCAVKMFVNPRSCQIYQIEEKMDIKTELPDDDSLGRSTTAVRVKEEVDDFYEENPHEDLTSSPTTVTCKAEVKEEDETEGPYPNDMDQFFVKLEPPSIKEEHDDVSDVVVNAKSPKSKFLTPTRKPGKSMKRRCYACGDKMSECSSVCTLSRAKWYDRMLDLPGTLEKAMSRTSRVYICKSHKGEARDIQLVQQNVAEGNINLEPMSSDVLVPGAGDPSYVLLVEVKEEVWGDEPSVSGLEQLSSNIATVLENEPTCPPRQPAKGIKPLRKPPTSVTMRRCQLCGVSTTDNVSVSTLDRAKWYDKMLGLPGIVENILMDANASRIHICRSHKLEAEEVQTNLLEIIARGREEEESRE